MIVEVALWQNPPLDAANDTSFRASRCRLLVVRSWVVNVLSQAPFDEAANDQWKFK